MDAQHPDRDDAAAPRPEPGPDHLPWADRPLSTGDGDRLVAIPTPPAGIPARPRRRGFLSWPHGPSLVNLLSATCLVGGTAEILGPGLNHEERIAERLGAVAAIAGYALALLVAVRLLVRWRRGNPDALALLVLLALLTPGTAAGLTTLAQDLPWTVLGLGLGAAAQGWHLVRRIAGPVTAPWPRALAIPVALVFLWGALSPGLLGIAFATDVRAEALAGWWRPGWLGVVLATLALAWAAGSARPRAADQGETDLGRSGLPWILGGMAVLAVGLAQALLVRGMFLPLAWPDLLAPAVGLMLAFDGHARHHGTVPGQDRTALWIVAWLVVAIAIHANGWEQGLAWDRFWCHPPCIMVHMGAGLLVQAVRHRQPWHLIPAALWAGLGMAQVGAIPTVQTAGHPLWGGATVLAILAAGTALTGRLAWLQVATALGTCGAGVWLIPRGLDLGLAPVQTIGGLVGAGQALLLILVPAQAARPMPVIVSVLLAVAATGTPWPWTLGGVGLIALLAWRCQRSRLLWTALVPAGVALWPLMVWLAEHVLPCLRCLIDHLLALLTSAWAAICAAFLLLAAGTWWSRRRWSRSQGTEVAP